MAEDQPEPAQELPQSITWTASEFIHHQKSSGWYLLLAIGTIVLAALVYLLTRDNVSTAVIVIAGLILGVYASHKPRQMEYIIDQSGLTIGGKHYAYQHFRSFSVGNEGAFNGITLMPLRRFAVPLTIYYPPEEEEAIVNILSVQLPFEEHRVDAIDAFMRRIRF